jgi:hypothetical protein
MSAQNSDARMKKRINGVHLIPGFPEPRDHIIPDYA